ncbi:MAG: tRNA 2-selenouridine(34) synthase MnmH [Candidatus Cloacimonadota bacterium]|nr:MAG: tRNA 2-selenouridine(34) synthase MnmH [Candidatus Cloacimonadota bacterium]
MIKEIKAEVCIKNKLPVVDVRSPGEFRSGHIPGAVNIPIFTDEERAVIGTVYKRESKEKAVKLGYEYVTPKLKNIERKLKEISLSGKFNVYCWRGGMRSHRFSEYAESKGFEPHLVTGGYKSFRHLVLSSFKQKFDLIIAGGFTGSGKTRILHELKKRGHQVIDLEGLANHKGSVFGAMGCPAQPSTEHFENKLFNELKNMDVDKPVWAEDESNNVGFVNIPADFFRQMREAVLYFMEIPRKKRAEYLTAEYGNGDDEALETGIKKISKRLGGLQTREALEALRKKDYLRVAEITLSYYDKYYLRGSAKRDPEKVYFIPFENTDYIKNTDILLKVVKEKRQSRKVAILR